MRSLKIFCFFILLLTPQTIVAFDLSDEDEIYRYFNTYRERDWMILEVIHEPILFSIGKNSEIALIPLEISVEGKYVPHKPQWFIVLEEHQENVWRPIGIPVEQKKIIRLFRTDAEMAFFKAGY